MLNSIFTYLKKVPFVGTAISAVGSNLRLYIEYFLIACIIAALATSLTLWYRTKYLESSNDELTTRVATLEVSDQIQDKTIDELRDLRQQDAKVMAGLIADHARLAKLDSAARRKLNDLESHNENVRSFLDQSIPVDLVCMLNNSCTDDSKTGKGDATSPVAKPVPRPGAKTAPAH